MQKSSKIYWEKQGVDKLCGLHCINGLLQAPIFNEMDLSQIGLQIDQQEQKLLFEMNQRQNVGMDGNFSIQVLSQALSNYNKIELHNAYQLLKKSQDLSNEHGFICNLDKHWFSIRKIDKIWYNLNSINQGPDIISDFYLSAYLQSIQEEGYTIFIVKGQYLPFDDYNYLQPHQFLFNSQQCQGNYYFYEFCIKSKNKINFSNSLPMETLKKIQMMHQKIKTLKKKSIHQYKQIKFKSILRERNCNIKQIFKIKIILKIFILNKSWLMMLKLTKQFKCHQQRFQKFIQKFLQQEKQGIQISFRLPEGGNIQWTFNQHQIIEDLYDFVKFKQNPEKAYKFVLMMGYPRQQLKSLGQTLIESDFDSKETIFVTKL